MKIAAKYSHLNGLDWLIQNKPAIWNEIQLAIRKVDASNCKTKISKEKTIRGKMLYAPTDLNKCFRKEFGGLPKWSRPGKKYFYCSSDPQITQRLIGLSLADQKELLLSKKLPLIKSYNEADFIKDRVSVEVQFGKYSFVQFDIFIKHAANYMQNEIDLGVEIVPMKSMEAEMSSGPPYYEKHLHEILRQGRIFPPVPLILIGVVP